MVLYMYRYGDGNGTTLQYSCLENPMDRGAWWAAVHGVAKRRTWLRDFTFTFHFHALEKEMAAYSSVLAWRIPGTGSNRRWQFGLWFLCLFLNQLEHQEVHGSCIAEAWLGEFWALLEFQLSYFKCWKMMLWKCCTQYASKLGKLCSGHRTGKGQFSFQSQRKAMPKNAQSTTLLHSSHMLVK